MQFIEKDVLKLDRILSELDEFVLNFIKILEKYSEYVIISGYVSILLGRSRATEDVDVFIKSIPIGQFSTLYEGLKKAGYWCLNGENTSEIYSYLKDGLAIRFALKNQTIPNFEVKFAIKSLSVAVFGDFITVLTPKGKLKISSFERQIAFKKFYLKSDKDLEDAQHIEKLFKENINQETINKYKRLIENELS